MWGSCFGKFVVRGVRQSGCRVIVNRLSVMPSSLSIVAAKKAGCALKAHAVVSRLFTFAQITAWCIHREAFSCSARAHRAGGSTMPPAMTVDIKIEFEQTDMIPGWTVISI